jgi:DNA helicase-2/ATP-dependent DNA helicase PcrA
MILSVIQQLGTDDELLAHYQEQFQYLLVDEYQDTNNSQNEFLKLLGSVLENPNIFVVGDDKQSIFRFQGASMENLRFFYAWQKERVKIISLTDNFRSQQMVIDAASAVIAHNTETISKHIPGIETTLLAATARREEPVDMTTYASEEAEVAGVARQVQAVLDEGVPAAEIAVLYRYNRDAAGVRDALANLGVATRVETSENTTDKPFSLSHTATGVSSGGSSVGRNYSISVLGV